MNAKTYIERVVREAIVRTLEEWSHVQKEVERATIAAGEFSKGRIEPGTFWGDWYILHGKPDCTDSDRMAALDRMAARIPVRAYDPAAKDGFRYLSPGESKQIHSLAVLAALERMSFGGQTYREGKKWTKGPDGRRLVFKPDSHFLARDEDAIIRYLKKEARNIIEEQFQAHAFLAYPQRSGLTDRSPEDALIAAEELAGQRQDQELLEAVKPRLSKRERQVLEMGQAGLDPAQISKRLGIKSSTVGVLKSRALNKIRALIRRR